MKTSINDDRVTFLRSAKKTAAQTPPHGSASISNSLNICGIAPESYAAQRALEAKTNTSRPRQRFSVRSMARGKDELSDEIRSNSSEEVSSEKQPSRLDNEGVLPGFLPKEETASRHGNRRPTNAVKQTAIGCGSNNDEANSAFTAPPNAKAQPKETIPWRSGSLLYRSPQYIIGESARTAHSTSTT